MSGLFYGCFRVLFNAIGRVLFGFRTVGREHVPRHGGLLIAANHASYLDIPALGCALPRRAYYLGRYDLFPNRLLGKALRGLGWIPMRHYRLDRESFGRAIELIKRGNAVVIYPEGTRSKDGRLGLGKPGIGIIVAETGCPVLPVYLEGTHEVLPVGAAWPRLRPIRVRIGEPIDFSSNAAQYAGKQFFQLVSRTVMERIAELGAVAPPTPRSGGSERAGTPESQPAAGPRHAE